MKLKWGGHIFNGDGLSEKALSFLPKSVNMVLFDPPFYLDDGEDAFFHLRGGAKHPLPPIASPKGAKYLEFFDQLCAHLSPIIWEKGYFVYKANLKTALKTIPIASDHFAFLSEAIWDKKALFGGTIIRNRHEYLLFFRPKGAKGSYTLHTARKGGLKSRSHGGTKNKAFPSVIEVFCPNGGNFGQDARLHMNYTPKELWEAIIRYFVPRGGSLYDPTMGSGSVGLACHSLGVNYFGSELLEYYYSIAASQLGNLRPQVSLLSYCESKDDASLT